MMAGALEPAGSIMGMDGTILLAFILGFPANEIVIPIALMSYLSQQAMSQATSLIAMESVLFSYGWTWMTAVSVMLFSLLHFPCGTTVYTIYKETDVYKRQMLSLATLLRVRQGFFLKSTLTGLRVCVFGILVL